MSASPNLRRGVSNIGKEATFGTSDEEVARILAHKQNYYICLKVSKTNIEFLLDHSNIVHLF